MATDFHDKCFDGSTLTKLDLFKKYLNEWLPVFIKGVEKKPANAYYSLL